MLHLSWKKSPRDVPAEGLNGIDLEAVWVRTFVFKYLAVYYAIEFISQA